MSTLEGLKPFPLLGGYNAQELWPLVNLILPTWILCVFLPRWKYTPQLTLVGPILHAMMYSLGVVSTIMYADENSPEIDYGSLESIVELFKDPSTVFIGWIHYSVYAALVGRWITLDAHVNRDASALAHVTVIVPVLFLSLMFGPMGWLLYVSIVRTFILKKKGGDAMKTEKKVD